MSDIIKVEDTPLVQTEEKDSQDVTQGIPESVLENLNARQLKFIRMEAGTAQDEKTLCQFVGVSMRKLGQWKKDPDFILARNKIKSNMFQADIQRDRLQNQMIKDKLFMETMSRFEEPDPDNDLPAGYTDKDYERYMKRFAGQSEFKDLMKAWHDADKRAKEDTSQIEDDVVTDTEIFVARIRSIAHKKQMAHKKRMEALGHERVDFNELFSLKTTLMNKDGTFPTDAVDPIHDVVDAEYEDIDLSDIDLMEIPDE